MSRPFKYVNSVFVKFRIEKEKKKKYKNICDVRGIKMQDDFNNYIDSVIEPIKK